MLYKNGFKLNWDEAELRSAGINLESVKNEVSSFIQWLQEIGLSKYQSKIVVNRFKIFSREDLTNIQSDDLLRIEHLGPKMVEKLKEKLREQGIELK